MADGSGQVGWAAPQKIKLVLQSEAAECALACLTMIACYHGHQIDIASLRRRFSSSLKGITLARLVEIAEALDMEARPLRAELEYLEHARMPCIAHWNLNHFVVIEKVKSGYVHIYDPAGGKRRVPIAQVSRHFTGVLVELTPSDSFEPVREQRTISIMDLLGRVKGVGRSVAQILSIAVAIEIISLVIPLHMQWVVDQALMSGTSSVIPVVGLAFAVIVIVQALLTAGRGWLISWLGADINAQWVTSMFSHLLKLPLDFFEKRHLGDVVSRFSSLYAIQSTLTGGFVAAIIDGVIGSIALAMLAFYSLPMTACVVATMAIYAGVRYGFFRAIWRSNEQQVVYQARQQTELMESIRGIQAIKLAGKQAERKSRLANATVEAARRSMVTQRFGFAITSINQALFLSQRILLVSIGAYLAIEGKFSAGMMIAFIAYADQFASKFGSLIDRISEFKMLGLHAERISDIAMSDVEKSHGSLAKDVKEGRIVLNNVSFRYSDSDPWVIRDLSIEIEPGESVAIVGRSGCGKSTLAKIMLGLLRPQHGTVAVGCSSGEIGSTSSCEGVMAAVMQDDSLFSGTIADNIAFCDPDFNMDDVIRSAMSASIHAEIMAMPMGYESLIGDMGSTLSGGQKQRVLLARALYQSPKVLILDEATSHLDVENERKTNETIKKLSMTRVTIAHRKETIEQADRIFDLSSACFIR